MYYNNEIFCFFFQKNIKISHNMGVLFKFYFSALSPKILLTKLSTHSNQGTQGFTFIIVGIVKVTKLCYYLNLNAIRILTIIFGFDFLIISTCKIYLINNSSTNY